MCGTSERDCSIATEQGDARMKTTVAITLACGVSIITGAFVLQGADPPRREAREVRQPVAAQPQAAAATFRARDVLGMPVRNPAGEEVGAVDDLVIDASTGHIQYAVMTYVSLDNREQ